MWSYRNFSITSITSNCILVETVTKWIDKQKQVLYKKHSICIVRCSYVSLFMYKLDHTEESVDLSVLGSRGYFFKSRMAPQKNYFSLKSYIFFMETSRLCLSAHETIAWNRGGQCNLLKATLLGRKCGTLHFQHKKYTIPKNIPKYTSREKLIIYQRPVVQKLVYLA